MLTFSLSAPGEPAPLYPMDLSHRDDCTFSTQDHLRLKLEQYHRYGDLVEALKFEDFRVAMNIILEDVNKELS